MNSKREYRNFIKRVISDSVICMLIMLNVFIGFQIRESLKPKCIVDGCNRSRCEQDYYCSIHCHAVEMESVVHYGKR